MSLKSQVTATALVLTAGIALTACGSGSSATGSPTPSTAPSTSPSAPPNPNATSDSYAFKHMCTSSQIHLTVDRITATPSQRLITVRNISATACGLSYFPQIDIGRAGSSDSASNIKPRIPGGLGGPPAFPIYAGARSYAVIDLNPSHAAASSTPGLNEMNVLAVTTMPTADTQNVDLGSGTIVNQPALGLYEASIADAIASMKGANTAQ